MEQSGTNVFRKYGTALTAAVASVAIFVLMQPKALTAAERRQMATTFHFTRTELPGPMPGVPTQQIRKVHPSLERIAAWISATGAAVTVCDLDGDGKSNDIVQVDPRTNQVTVFPAPGTGERYERFALTVDEPVNAGGIRVSQSLDAHPRPYHSDSGSAPRGDGANVAARMSGSSFPRIPPNVPYYDATKMAPMGTLVGDVNEDGVPDVIVYYWGRTPIAFMGTGTAGGARKPSADTYHAVELMPGNKDVWSTSCGVIADFDGDGHQDLLFCNYFRDGDEVLNPKGTGVVYLQDSIANALNGGGKHLLRWTGMKDGAPQYVDDSAVFDAKVGHGWTIAVGAQDLDDDMLPEIYFANDTGPDHLLHNRSTPGHIDFAVTSGESGFNVPTSFVLGHDSFKGMGCDFGDMNRDGVPDIYVSNIAAEFGLQESHYLWLSGGGANELKSGIAPYKQASEQLGLSRSGWGWDCRLADFNNDGVFETVQATGFIKGTINRWPELQSISTSNNLAIKDPRVWPKLALGDDVSGHEKNAFFVKANDGKYYNCAEDIGIADDTVTRGIAVADLDADGKPDFVTANQWEKSFVYHNDSKKGGEFMGVHFLLPVHDKGRREPVVHDGAIAADQPSSPAIGAAVAIDMPDGFRRYATVDGGSGHSGKRAPEIMMGLGALPPNTVLPVQVRWRARDGRVMQKQLKLQPGWHTVELYSGDGGAKPTT